MKKTFHLCHSSKEEVMFRSEEDYNWAFNCYAMALAKTDSDSLAHAHMSNHRHHVVQSACPGRLMQISRLAYTRHMNSRYGRKGPLGEEDFFTIEIEGLHHLLAALSYVKRNALHHGVASTPFAYPYSSANSIFARERGINGDSTILPRRYYHRYVGRNVDIPDHFRMTTSGHFLFSDVIAVNQVELIYVTPRGYLYYMNRPSGEEWHKEQREDAGGVPPITVEMIEEGTALTTSEMLFRNEKGRADYRRLSDIQLCGEIDRIVLHHFKEKSVYTLSYSQKCELYRMVRELYHVDDKQAQRCLAMNY